MSIITYKLLDQFTEIAHFCTSRQGGVSVGNYASFNLGPYTGDNMLDVTANLQRLNALIGIESLKIAIPYQTHGIELREIDKSYFQLSNKEKESYLNGVDGVFTQLTQVCVAVTTADCVPLLFFDPIKKVIAAVHAGWRGTCAGITKKMILTLIEYYGSNPLDIRVAIGPSISSKVYEVGKEVVTQFSDAGFQINEIVAQRNNRFYLDLWKANSSLLNSLGITDEHIEVSGICTYTEHENYFSARRLGIKSGRLLSGIVMR
jgi:polyphenol oxidase